MSFSLRFPIRLAPGRSIAGAEEWRSASIGGREFHVRLEGRYLAIRVEGFPAENLARGFLPKLRTALYWVALEWGLAFTAELAFDRVVSHSDPEEAARNINRSFGTSFERVHGLVNGNRPCTYPSDRPPRTMTVGEPTVVMAVPPDKFFRSLEVGLGCTNPRHLDDQRIETALSLFCAKSYEGSEGAKLLALVMALETLAERRERPALVLGFLEQWKREVSLYRSQLDEASEEYEALESLERELLFRKEASLRSSVRSLVRDTLEAAGDSNALEISRRAVGVYDARSTLLHEGRLSKKRLRRAVSDAEVIVAAVLKAKIQEAV